MENLTIWIMSIIGGVILSGISIVLPERFRYLPQLITFIATIILAVMSRIYGG